MRLAESICATIIFAIGAVVCYESIHYGIGWGDGGPEAGLYLAVYMRWIGRHRWVTVATLGILIPLAGYVVFWRWRGSFWGQSWACCRASGWRTG